VQWGDGTHAKFFLPSAPSPAEVAPPLGKKNAYINLPGGNLAFNYNGPVTLHVGITGGGGGPHRARFGSWRGAEDLRSCSSKC
jgi:hypothetical protein